MAAQSLQGKPIRDAILAEVREGVEQLTGAGHSPPHLTAVLVGDDPASAIYVRSKRRACAEVGMQSDLVEMPAATSTEQLIGIVGRLNAAPEVDGILVQLPLPEGVDETAVLDAVDPAKDVDGLHPENIGLLWQGRVRFSPATPSGIVEMLDRHEIPIAGRDAVIVGRSDIVGKPMAALLLHRHATVTLCHSRTADLPAVCRRADILVAAVGRAGLITRDHVKPGATVVDVGINRVSDREVVEDLLGDAADWDRFEERGYLVVGDIRPDVREVAGALTPVPGGVGPLTISMLLVNTLTAARARRLSPSEK